MKVFCNRVPISGPWGGGNQFLHKMIETLVRHNHEVVHELMPDIDVIFMIDPRPGNTGCSIEHIAHHKWNFPKTKILHRVNECDARKGTNEIDRLLYAGMSISDSVVFISRWLRNHFSKLYPELELEENGSVIYNGCNIDHFYPGSQGSLKKMSLVTHHWSDNWMKGFDIYTQIDQYLVDNPSADFEFTYVGRYNSSYEPKATTLVEPLYGVQLGNELRKHDAYVTASRWEPCGMHHIEGAASGLPVLYHRDCGGINELCSNHGEEFVNFDDFLIKLSVIRKSYQDYVDSIQNVDLDINSCCQKFLAIVENFN